MKLISQLEVIEMLRSEGLEAGISNRGTICAFVKIPMYDVVATPDNVKNLVTWYKRAEVARFIADYRMAKAGSPQFRDK